MTLNPFLASANEPKIFYQLAEKRHQLQDKRPLSLICGKNIFGNFGMFKFHLISNTFEGWKENKDSPNGTLKGLQCFIVLLR